MMNTLLIEDEFYIRKALVALISSLDKDLTIIGECGTIKDAVTMVNACKPDLVFLDINLPDGNAFEFLELTKTLKYKVIFITAYDEYALQALKKGAVDYILKPVDITELEAAIDKAIETSYQTQETNLQVTKNQMDNKRLVISLHDEYQVVNFNELIFCKSDKGYTTFYLTNGKSILASKPIKEFIDKLPDSIFVRTHQSYVVNLDHVDRYDKKGTIFLKGGQKIPVSTRKKDEFISRLLNKN